eukprot:4282706-Pleurochrysis_carterae.AAC.1
MLNVAALSAAIAIGAMQFIDAGTTLSLTSRLPLYLVSYRALRYMHPARVPPTRRGELRPQAKRA